MTGTHDMYTVLWSDKFWWIKESTGSTWDINLYDNDYIYWWITQPTWGDARNYSMATYTTNFVAAPRCAASGYPGTGTNIVNNDTSHDIYFDCIYSNTANVGKAVFSVWGPYSLSFGGDLPNDMPVYILSYSWGCGDTFNDCVKEEYYLSQRYGLVAWQFYNNVNGQHVLNQTSIFNHLANGTVSPNFECF
jgi:hypothetical protein